MNKFQKKLALLLIDRRLKKLEKQGIKKWRAETNFGVKKKASPLQYIEHTESYRYLRELRFNIETINNPWQGVFNPYFKLYPKKQKYIEKFEEFEITKPEELPLSEADQKWAELDSDEFLEALEQEPDDELFKVKPSD